MSRSLTLPRAGAPPRLQRLDARSFLYLDRLGKAVRLIGRYDSADGLAFDVQFALMIGTDRKADGALIGVGQLPSGQWVAQTIERDYDSYHHVDLIFSEQPTVDDVRVGRAVSDLTLFFEGGRADPTRECCRCGRLYHWLDVPGLGIFQRLDAIFSCHCGCGAGLESGGSQQCC